MSIILSVLTFYQLVNVIIIFISKTLLILTGGTNYRAELFIRPVVARCVHMADRTDAHHGVVPSCHAVGWVAPLLHIVDSCGSGLN